MFMLSPISSGLEFWSANHTSINESSELKVFDNIKFCKISSKKVKYLVIDQMNY